MQFVDASEARLLDAISQLTDSNPFLPERVECERRILGDAFADTATVWHAHGDLDDLNPNVAAIIERVEQLASRLRHRLAEGARARPAELSSYEGLIRHLLYYRYLDPFTELVALGEQGRSTTRRVGAHRRFAADVSHFLEIPGVALPVPVSASDLFAWGFQIRRAFRNTFRRILGGSMPAARLRAAVWQSIFTHDRSRYRRSLSGRMSDIPTLITGESGTGKELVARAIGLSRHIPFDGERQAFAEDYATGFLAVNLSALSPTLIESELFGHRRGAFTGAVEDRDGWLASAPAHGAVFLDEIGELDPAVQVKLLRLLQNRSYQRIGESVDREFKGKIIAATNRDLVLAMGTGGFRADFYYRLCADQIETPSLREQLADTPEDLRNLLLVISARVAGDEEAASLAEEVEGWIQRNLGDSYAWPGNVRELEQCVRSIVVRGTYAPNAALTIVNPLGDPLLRGELTAEELLRHYCTRVYDQAGSYEEAARRLGLDRRTVKAKVDSKLLHQLRTSADEPAPP